MKRGPGLRARGFDRPAAGACRGAISRRALLAGLVLVAALAATVPRVLRSAQAYLYGYPLVLVELTRADFESAAGGANRLLRLRRFPDADFKAVVRPNVDTLYTSAFIDMAQGPWVFEAGAENERYELFQFMDGWSNVFASPGTLTGAADGLGLLLVGPGWQGEVPAGLQVLRAPTRIVWLLARTETRGAADYAVAHRLQDAMHLRPLADWRAGVSTAPQPPPARRETVPPVRRLDAMSTDEFFARLARSMADNPPAAGDAPMLAKLAQIGLVPGRPPQWNLLESGCAALGRWAADAVLDFGLRHGRASVRGWTMPPAVIGHYGSAYAVRAGVARVGLGANLPQDAVYPTAMVDAAGHELDGSRRYRLHFERSALPPVDAFWSVTAYGPDNFLIANPAGRYALGDRDPLVFNADGSLDLLIQAEAPDARWRANWLPVQAGRLFSLTARLYAPRSVALDGTWTMPAVQRLE